MVDLSVIICSHNPRPHYLHRTLNALRHQTLSCEQWELLIVDNASREPLSSAYDISWHPVGRHIVEPELGLAPARRRGVQEAAGNVFIFVDDDNVLDCNYLAEANRIGHDWSSLGVWGAGQIVGEFEIPPSAHLRRYLPYLALREASAAQWANIFPCVQATPWGAGMCVRPSVANAYCNLSERARIHVTGRRGDALLSGDDVEMSIVACQLGLGMGIFPELKLVHLIPKERLRDDYLVNIIEGTNLSNCLLEYKWRGVVPNSPFSVWGILSVIKNVLVHRGIDRRMYLARLRGTMKAKRVIAEAGSLPMVPAIDTETAFRVPSRGEPGFDKV